MTKWEHYIDGFYLEIEEGEVSLYHKDKIFGISFLTKDDKYLTVGFDTQNQKLDPTSLVEIGESGLKKLLSFRYLIDNPKLPAGNKTANQLFDLINAHLNP